MIIKKTTFTRTTSVLLATALLLGACSNSNADVSPQGQVAYACALAKDIKETFDANPNWWDDVSRPEVDAMLASVTGFGALLGGVTGGGAEISQEMQDDVFTVVMGVSQLNESRIHESVDAVVEACDKADDIKPSGDVSAEGQIDYACALATDIKDADGPASRWELKIGADTSPALVKAISAAALVGGATDGTAAALEAMSDAGRTLFEGTSRMNIEMLQEGIDDLNAACAAR